MGNILPNNAAVRWPESMSVAPVSLPAWPRALAVTRVLLGLVLCFAVTLVAEALAQLEADLFGRAWIEALILAIVVGSLNPLISAHRPSVPVARTSKCRNPRRLA